MIPKDHDIAVAVSGGADSVALAAAVAEVAAKQDSSRRLYLLHCNFHLRGMESDRDAEVARQIADTLSIPFISTDFHDVRDTASHSGESLEMICRRLRYDWFADTLSKLPAPTWLALGHHVEDNRETMLLNLLRGTGTRGLAGMAEADTNRRLIRPLLHVTREEIEKFLSERNLPWITDSSNLIADVKRNKLRLNIIPAIKADFRDALSGMDTTMANIADDYAILKQALQKTISDISIPGTTGTFDLKRLREISPSPRRVIFEIVRAAGFKSAQAADMANCTSTAARLFHSSTHTVTVHRNKLTLQPRDRSMPVTIEADDPFTLASLSGEFYCKRISTEDPLSFIMNLRAIGKPFYAMDATEPLPRTWTWRQPATADRIAPYGMKGRTRLVSDILTDAHASPAQKKETRLLVADGTPLWLAPLRASGVRPVTVATKEILIFFLK